MNKIINKAALPLILVIFSISCNSGRIFHEKYTFEDYSWTIDEKIVFHPEIAGENTGKQLQAIIHIRYITGFSHKYLNFNLILTRPDGSQGTKVVSIQMLTDDKKYRGNGMGDIWDLDYDLSEPMIFTETGIYEIEIKPIMDAQPLNFINEFGFSLNTTDDSK